MGSLNFFKVTCVKKSASADEKEHEVNGAAEQRRNWQENRHYEVAAHRRPRVLLERVKGERRRRRQGERNILYRVHTLQDLVVHWGGSWLAHVRDRFCIPSLLSKPKDCADGVEAMVFSS